MKKNSFKRIKGNLFIKKIIKYGNVISINNIKSIYLIDNTDNYIIDTENQKKFNKISVFVPKKFIKHSVKRNLIKRLIKESFRLEQNILNEKIYNIIFIYKYYKVEKNITIKNYIKDILYIISRSRNNII